MARRTLDVIDVTEILVHWQAAGRDGQQAIGGERAPARRDHHERVRRSRIGPPRWQREQLPVLVMQVDPVLTRAAASAAGGDYHPPAFGGVVGLYLHRVAAGHVVHGWAAGVVVYRERYR
jgi:hypothetical protein